MSKNNELKRYENAYKKNEDFKKYVDLSMRQSGKTLKETLEIKTVQFVFDCLYDKEKQ